MSAPLAALLRKPAPGPGQIAVTAGAASTSAQAIPAGARRVWMKCTNGAHIRFGDSAVGAATTDDQRLTPDVDYLFDLDGQTHWRALRAGETDAVITWVAS